jgi:hypothetical protein
MTKLATAAAAAATSAAAAVVAVVAVAGCCLFKPLVWLTLHLCWVDAHSDSC